MFPSRLSARSLPPSPQQHASSCSHGSDDLPWLGQLLTRPRSSGWAPIATKCPPETGPTSAVNAEKPPPKRPRGQRTSSSSKRSPSSHQRRTSPVRPAGSDNRPSIGTDTLTPGRLFEALWDRVPLKTIGRAFYRYGAAHLTRICRCTPGLESTTSPRSTPTWHHSPTPNQRPNTSTPPPMNPHVRLITTTSAITKTHPPASPLQGATRPETRSSTGHQAPRGNLCSCQIAKKSSATSVAFVPASRQCPSKGITNPGG